MPREAIWGNHNVPAIALLVGCNRPLGRSQGQEIRNTAAGGTVRHTQQEHIPPRIKPGDLLLTTDEVLFIADFSLVSSDVDCPTRAGTLGYRFPELLRGERCRANQPDVWAAAVVIFMMLMDPAFRGESGRAFACYSY
jgi:hypothetical protein